MSRLLTREEFLTAEMSEGEKRLWRVADAVKRRRKPSPADMQFLAAAFDNILDGTDAKKALGISGKQYQGRQALTAEQVDERHLPIAVDVYETMKSGRLREDAIDHVAAQRGEKRSFVEDCYKRCGRTARWLVDVVSTWGKK